MLWLRDFYLLGQTHFFFFVVEELQSWDLLAGFAGPPGHHDLFVLFFSNLTITIAAAAYGRDLWQIFLVFADSDI